jgi:hypothetical protein
MPFAAGSAATSWCKASNLLASVAVSRDFAAREAQRHKKRLSRIVSTRRNRLWDVASSTRLALRPPYAPAVGAPALDVTRRGDGKAESLKRLGWRRGPRRPAPYNTVFSRGRHDQTGRSFREKSARCALGSGRGPSGCEPRSSAPASRSRQKAEEVDPPKSSRLHCRPVADTNSDATLRGLIVAL